LVGVLRGLGFAAVRVGQEYRAGRSARVTSVRWPAAWAARAASATAEADGHRGSGLARVADPDRTETLEPTARRGCGVGLAGAPGTLASSVQVFDLPTLALRGGRVPADAPRTLVREDHDR